MKGVVLYGLPGVGKTTAGKLLAADLGWRFIDSDARIQERTGLTCAELHAQAGECGFRVIEQEIILELDDLTDTILAVGGGAMMDEKVYAHLRTRAILFHLEADLEVLKKRLKKRPHLLHELDKRLPYYRSIADG